MLDDLNEGDSGYQFQSFIFLSGLFYWMILEFY